MTEKSEPAFPTNEKHSNGSHERSHLGMTLRDYFAGQALAGGVARAAMLEYELVRHFGEQRAGIRREEIIAADAYAIADAMLKARED